MNILSSMPIDGSELPSLGTLSRDEWREVVRKVRPDVDDDAFDALWQQGLALRYVHRSCEGSA